MHMHKRTVVVVLGLALVLIPTVFSTSAFAAPKQVLPEIQTYSSPAQPVDSQIRADSCPSLAPVSALATIYQRTMTTTKTYKSLVGIVTAKFIGTTYWTFDYTRLQTNHQTSNSYQTFLGTWGKDRKSEWSWYNAGVTNGSGRALNQIVFCFGVPTPWGTVGKEYCSTINQTVYYNGTYSAY